MPTETATAQPANERLGWVDYAKGLCIILVVMMHTVNGYESLATEEGWLRLVVDFAKPFRMPDFFLISGLFLSRSLHGPARSYFDRKLLHFVYFYVLWLAIQLPILEFDLLVRSPGYFVKTWILALFEPTNTLWFVHMLAVFYVVTWVLRDVPKWIVLFGAIALQTVYQFGLIDSGWNVLDRFCNRYIYFYLGYAAAPHVFKLAKYLSEHLVTVLIALPVWAFANHFMIEQDLHNLPGISLLLGLAGALAICAISACLDRFDIAHGLRRAGEHSIVIYLSFFLPMTIMTNAFHAWGDPFGSVGLSTALILATAVATPLGFHHLIKKSRLIWLYERPDMFKLTSYPSLKAHPAQ